MQSVIFLLLTIFFFGCASKEKEIVSSELIYSNYSDKGGLQYYDSIRVDTIFIIQKDEIKKLQEIISNSDRYYGLIKMPIKYRLIVHYKDSEKKLFVSGNYYKTIPDLEYYKSGSEKQNKRDEEKYYKSTENFNIYCEELITKYTKK